MTAKHRPLSPKLSTEPSVKETGEEASSLILPSPSAEEGPSHLPSCHIMLRNHGISPLQCSGWKSLKGQLWCPPSPLIYPKTACEFQWSAKLADEGVRGGFSYRCSHPLDEPLGLFVYFNIPLWGENQFLIKFLNGEGLNLDHLPTLEATLEGATQLTEAHAGTYHVMATLSETPNAMLIIDLWNDYA